MKKLQTFLKIAYQQALSSQWEGSSCLINQTVTLVDIMIQGLPLKKLMLSLKYGH